MDSDAATRFWKANRSAWSARCADRQAMSPNTDRRRRASLLRAARTLLLLAPLGCSRCSSGSCRTRAPMTATRPAMFPSATASRCRSSCSSMLGSLSLAGKDETYQFTRRGCLPNSMTMIQCTVAPAASEPSQARRSRSARSSSKRSMTVFSDGSSKARLAISWAWFSSFRFRSFRDSVVSMPPVCAARVQSHAALLQKVERP